MTDEPLVVERTDHAAHLTLNRPQVMNALNSGVMERLHTTLRRLKGEREVRVVSLTGAGDRTFCAGADLKERAELDEQGTAAVRRTLVDLFTDIAAFPKPLVAAVNGAALGGGFELALLCDIIIAAEGAVFALPETGLGIIPGGGGTQTLTRVAGPQTAKRLIFTGERIDAGRALELGIVSQVTPADRLEETAEELVERIASKAPLALEQAKKAIQFAQGRLIAGMRYEAEAYQRCLFSDDRVEGLQAFREKREPQYRGQ